jgi:hypothetical protein
MALKVKHEATIQTLASLPLMSSGTNLGQEMWRTSPTWGSILLLHHAFKINPVF